MSPIYAVLIFFIICTGVCYSVAKKRKANVPFWVVMGCLFGPLAIPFVFFSKPKTHAPT